LLDSKVERAHVGRPCPKLLAFFSGWQPVVGCPKIKRCAQAPKTVWPKAIKLINSLKFISKIPEKKKL
jgi:hypothetical protein